MDSVLRVVPFSVITPLSLGPYYVSAYTRGGHAGLESSEGDRYGAVKQEVGDNRENRSFERRNPPLSPKGKVKATVVDIALLFAALTLKETWRFVIDLQKDAGMDIRPGSGSRDELEALIFVAFCHDLCLQSTAFGIYGKLLSQRFRETLALWKETSGAFPSISGYDLLFMMDQRFEEYYLAMKATDPLVKVGAVFTRHVGGCHDVIISTRAAICLRATLEFLGPVGNQYEIIEPEVAQIPRSAVAPTIQAHLKRMED